MKRMTRFVLVGCMVLLLLAPVAASAAGPATTCTAGATIFTTSTGTVTNAGQVTMYQDSGVAGAYTSGFLSGYTYTGSQNIVVNNVTASSTLNGWYTATGSGGTFRVRYTGMVDLSTGATTGHFVVMGGTGDFAGFHWSGDIDAQLVSLTPPTFQATNSGMCVTAP